VTESKKSLTNFYFCRLAQPTEGRDEGHNLKISKDFRWHVRPSVRGNRSETGGWFIQEVGEKLTTSNECIEIDASEKYAMPSLIDAHVHVCASEVP